MEKFDENELELMFNIISTFKSDMHGKIALADYNRINHILGVIESEIYSRPVKE